MTRLSKIQSSYFDTIHTAESSELLQLLSGSAGKLSKKEAIQVYAEAYLYRLAEVLFEKYPAVKNILGEEDFVSLAKDYIAKTPSSHYDIGRYGETFPEFVSEIYPKYPFLYDLAQLELELDALFRKKQHIPFIWNTPFESNDLDQAVLSFGESFSLLSFEHSILKLWEERNANESFEVETLLGRENILIYKKKEDLFVRRLDEDEFLFLNHLRRGDSIGDTLSFLEATLQWKEGRVEELFSNLAEMEIVSSVAIGNHRESGQFAADCPSLSYKHE